MITAKTSKAAKLSRITHVLITESNGIKSICRIPEIIVKAIIYGIPIEQLPSQPIAGWGYFDGPSQPEYKIQYCAGTFSLPSGVTLDDLKAYLDQPVTREQFENNHGKEPKL